MVIKGEVWRPRSHALTLVSESISRIKEYMVLIVLFYIRSLTLNNPMRMHHECWFSTNRGCLVDMRAIKMRN